MRDFLREIIQAAGALSLEYREGLGTIKFDRKSEKDLVTEADVAVEKLLIAKIKDKYPGHAILGEESGEHGGDEYRWIIDPIDGTASFLHGQPFYSISIALEKAGEVVLGAVYAPVLGELFEAAKGEGAFLNGEPICVSKRDRLIDSMVGTGFACVRSDLAHNNLPYFAAVIPKSRGIRRYGSAAVDLCYVAVGRLEGFWELNLKIYDVAAGVLILLEAGGKVSDYRGNDTDGAMEILATNGLIHAEMVSILGPIRESY
jgi:myo-inositol-1(or 4)-monophosphatase